MIPNPLDLITDAATGWAWDKVVAGIGQWVLDAITAVLSGIVNFLQTSARADVTDAWFSGAGSPHATVRNLAGVLMVGFLLAGIIQGLAANDVSGMIRRVAVDAPLAIVLMVGTITVVNLLLDLTDALSTEVLGGSGGSAVQFLSGFGHATDMASGGFASVLAGLIIVICGALIWIELLVRASLTYLLVALSPLAFACLVWPAARGTAKRLVELLLAVILSKLVISIALAVGVAALGGAGSSAGSNAGVGEQMAQGLGTLMIGAGLMGLAACSPYVLLRLFPLAESALAAQGISRSPARGAQSTMGTVYYASSMKRLAGGGGSGGGGGPETLGSPPTGGPEVGAATTAGGGAAGATSGAAAAGPAAAVAVPVAAATTAAKHAAKTASTTADAASSLSDSGTSGHSSGDRPIPNEPTSDSTEPFPGGAT